MKVKGLAYKSKKKDIRQFFYPFKPKSIRIPPKLKGIAHVGFDTEKETKKALIKHLGFLAGKRHWVLRYERRNHCEKEQMIKIQVNGKSEE